MPSIKKETSSMGSRMRRGLRRPAEVPEWWPLLQIGLGVVLVVGLAWALLAGNDTPQLAPPNTNVYVPPAEVSTIPPTATTQPLDPNAPSTTAPPLGEGQVALPGPGGTTAVVASVAVDRAKAALRASGGPEATFETITVVEQSADRLTLAVAWYPNGRGVSRLITTTVPMVFDGQSWSTTSGHQGS